MASANGSEERERNGGAAARSGRVEEAHEGGGSETGMSPPAAFVPLTHDVGWIHECYDLGDRHEHVSVYLIRTDEGNIIVDSGSFYHRERIRSRLSEATQDQGVQALILSHSDYPHSANIAAFRKLWGDFEIVASCGDPGIQGLPYARPSKMGQTLTVLGRRFRFLDPPLADRSHTTWIYDLESRVMFVADGFGNYHGPGQCDILSSELPGDHRARQIHGFHQDTLTWLRYVDPRVMNRVLQRLFDDQPVSFVAPIHGNPIPAADLDVYLDHLKESVARIAESYAVP